MNKKALNHIKNEWKLKFYIPSKYAKYTIFRHKITQFLALTNNPLGRSLCYKFRSILSQKPYTYFSRENSSIVCWKLSGNYIFSLDEPCDIHLQLQSYCIAWCTRLGLRWKYIFCCKSWYYMLFTSITSD